MKKTQVSYEDVKRKKKQQQQWMWMNNNNNNNNNNKINMTLRLNTTQRYSVEDECSKQKKRFFQLKFQVGYNTKDIQSRRSVENNMPKYL
jgi:hypothetical protein